MVTRRRGGGNRPLHSRTNTAASLMIKSIPGVFFSTGGDDILGALEGLDDIPIGTYVRKPGTMS